MATRATKRTGLYLQVVNNGRMGMFVNSPTDFSEVYTNAEGKSRNFEFYETIEGKLSKTYCYDKEFGQGKTVEMFVITLINSEGDKESLTMPFNSNYAQSFIKRLEGININESVMIKTFKIKNKEKSEEKKKDIFNELCLPYQKVNKEWKILESLYKKDSEKTLPEAKQEKVKEKGKIIVKYDFTNQKEALREVVKAVNSVLPKDNETYQAVNELDHDTELTTEEEVF